MATSVRAGIRHLLSRIAISTVPVSSGCGAAAAAAAQGLGFGKMTGLAAIAARMRGLSAMPVEVEAIGSENTNSIMATATRPYVKTKKLTKQAKHIMQLLDREAVDTAVKERSIPRIKPGDIVQLKVEVPENKRRVSQLKGIVIAKRNAGISSTIRIRRVLAGVGVEVVYPLYSPNIKEIKVISSRRVRRAKLYYLRDKIAKLSTF